METSTTELSPLIPFKSKKPLLTTPVKNHHHKHHQQQPPSSLGVATPDRANPPPRVRNQNFALSVADVRRTALQLRKGNTNGVGSGSGFDGLTRVGSKGGKVKGTHKSTTLLPQKYEMLSEFFTAMVNSIRLLRIKRLPATLAQLSRNIESLTDRRFTLHHLAQLKHIMPEVIVVKKIRVQDEVTSCMKEELLISLEADAVETEKNSKGSGGFTQLKEIFRTRISDYATNHPEGDDLPQGELPELFYKPKQEPEPSMDCTPALRPATLIPPTIKRRFSSRAFSAAVLESSAPKLSASLPETPLKEATSAMSKDVSVSLTVDTDATPVKVASPNVEFASTPAKCAPTPAKFVSTPAEEVVSTPAKLMAATPSLRTPKRSAMIDDGAYTLTNKSAKRRALRFEDSSNDARDQSSQAVDTESDVNFHGSAATKDLLEVLPPSLLQSLMEKERRTLEEQDPVVSQARRRQQLMASIPKLFDMIQLLFQSVRRSVMTKEELIHKILTGHLDIVDKREVEEQLKLLQEVAPEFITEKSCLSGDTLLSINKASCSDSIRAKLDEAK